MFIVINKEACIGCATCEMVCPKNFKVGNDEKAEVISQEDSGCVRKAVKLCPVQAIKVE